MKTRRRSAALDEAIMHIEAALATGIKGNNRQAIQDCLDLLTTSTHDISEIQYKNLKVGKTLTDPDRPGFRMRRNKHQSLWIYRYNWEGGQKEFQLGTFPEVSLAEARQKWLAARQRRLKGEDPATQSESGMMTIKTLVGKYITEYCREEVNGEPRKRSWKESKKILERELVERYGDKPVDQLSPEDLSKMFLAVQANGRRAAEKLWSEVSVLFRVAVGKTRKKDFLQGTWLPADFRHPLDAVPSLMKQAPDDDKTLTATQLKKFMKGLKKLKIADLLLLQFQTCSRVSEVSEMRFSEIDWEEKCWYLPKGRVKTKQAHKVMLSDQSYALLERRREEITGEWVFPSAFDPKRPIRADYVAEIIAKNRKALGVPEKFTSHWLRHVSLTKLGGMQCPGEIQDRISNHKPPETNMRTRYNKEKYDEPAREWLQKWSDHLETYTAQNVVHIDDKRA